MRDYPELIAGLRDCAKHTCCSAPPATSLAADAIEELLAAVPQWISVEERLPTADDGDPWDRCFVYTDEGQLQTLPLCKVGMGYVTHWMKVEPPKEVE